MIDERFLYGAIAIMLIIIARDVLKKYCNFDMDKFDVIKFAKNFKKICSVYYKKYFLKKDIVIAKHTGNKSLELVDMGENPATVMATLRQITGITYDHAKWISQAVPVVFMTNISDAEADLNKKALEFVGAKVEIR